MQIPILYEGQIGEVYKKGGRIRARVELDRFYDVSLTRTTKMPGYSWNLPAGEACPASKLTLIEHGQEAVCSVCYAKAGNYRFPHVKETMQERFSLCREALKTGPGLLAAILTPLVEAGVYESDEPFFRIHDSGDFFSPAYVEAWYLVGAALPDVRFWAPTREHLRELMLPSLRKLASLPNMAIRPSAAKLNQEAPVVQGLSDGTAVVFTVPEGHKVCPSTSTEEHSCDAHGCRACWYEGKIAYVAHGQQIRSRQPQVLCHSS